MPISFRGLAVAAAILPFLGGAQAGAANPAAPADSGRTVSVAFRAVPAQGGSDLCLIEFVALVRAAEPSSGKLVKVSGAFSYQREREGWMTYRLRIGLVDDPDGAAIPLAPADAYLRAPEGRSPEPMRRLDPTAPGYAFFLGNFGDRGAIDAYRSIIEHASVVVGFNRAPGQPNVEALLDLTVSSEKAKDDEVARSPSPNAVGRFYRCVVEAYGDKY